MGDAKSGGGGVGGGVGPGGEDASKSFTSPAPDRESIGAGNYVKAFDKPMGGNIRFNKDHLPPSAGERDRYSVPTVKNAREGVSGALNYHRTTHGDSWGGIQKGGQIKVDAGGGKTKYMSAVKFKSGTRTSTAQQNFSHSLRRTGKIEQGYDPKARVMVFK